MTQLLELKPYDLSSHVLSDSFSPLSFIFLYGFFSTYKLKQFHGTIISVSLAQFLSLEAFSSLVSAVNFKVVHDPLWFYLETEGFFLIHFENYCLIVNVFS